jgi:methyl-accepting chemotaxis protein
MNDRNRQLTQLVQDIAFSSDLLKLQYAVEAGGSSTPATEFAEVAVQVRELAKRGEQAVQQGRQRKPENTV